MYRGGSAKLLEGQSVRLGALEWEKVLKPHLRFHQEWPQPMYPISLASTLACGRWKGRRKLSFPSRQGQVESAWSEAVG